MVNLYFVFTVDETEGGPILFLHHRSKGGNIVRNARKPPAYVCFEGIDKQNFDNVCPLAKFVNILI